jgi:site-specific DNA-methyltransferase (adenine-specific)
MNTPYQEFIASKVPRAEALELKPYYQDDFTTIYHGDCREILPSVSNVDHVISDPPYADETHDGARTGKHDGAKKLVNFGSISVEELRFILWLCKPSRWVVATMDWRHILPLEQCPPKGLRFVRFGIWDKPTYTPQFTGDRPATGWEAIGLLHKEGGRMEWNGGGTRAVWTHNKEQNNQHPTEKPVGFVANFVKLFTDAGETILDPFMGSGTTLVAAKQLGRKAIGIELEEKYCEIAAKRLQQEYLPLTTEPIKQPVEGVLL